MAKKDAKKNPAPKKDAPAKTKSTVMMFAVDRAIDRATADKKAVGENHKGGIIYRTIRDEFDGKATLETLDAYFVAPTGDHDKDAANNKVLSRTSNWYKNAEKRKKYLAGYLQWLVGNGNLKRVSVET